MSDAARAPVNVETAKEGGALVFRLTGELDIQSASSAQDAVDAALGGGAERAVFDLQGLTFMDSSGIALLLSVARRLPVEVRNPSAVIRQVIEMTGLAHSLGMSGDG